MGTKKLLEFACVLLAAVENRSSAEFSRAALGVVQGAKDDKSLPKNVLCPVAARKKVVGQIETLPMFGGVW